MTVKNKLYKHHKSKFVLVMRNLSISVAGFFALGAIAAIPTYISANQISEAEAKEQAPIHQASDENMVEEETTILEYKLD